ncbi:DUF401 family protein [Halanaerobiaceae bacterium Z-7014]|uniref:DUF401 family protein n=1 Tax=Halonatronomonas betaini TaxID=2778430 RepID=A0A931AR01_9FIRM|nr:DUF401 family protein [Halonatronomonas betaini]MBF8436489.1 DUF401 family protein [Halonatronomonas betaini]
MLPLIGVIISFFTVVILLSMKKSLGAAMFIGSLIVGISSTNDIAENIGGLIPTFVTGIIDPIAIELIVLVSLVAVFGYLMKELELLTDLIDVARYYLSSIFFIITAIPSMIGVLPMPGGAVFSAPIIEPIGDQMEMSSARLTSLNIYYRHLWYFIFPYMPSMIIASSLSNINVMTIALMHIPIVGIMIIIGWIYYNNDKKKLIQKEVNQDCDTEEVSFLDAIKVLLPFVIVLFPPLILDISFVYALIVAILYIILLRKDLFEWKYLLNGMNLQLTVGVAGIMVFKAFIENSEGVMILTELLISFGIPLFLLALFIPFIAGLLTGNHTGAIGISYPILLTLFTDSSMYLLWHMIIFSSSYFGYVLSPFHLCNLMTVKYYNISLDKYYKEIIVPFAGTAAGIFLLSVIYYFTII